MVSSILTPPAINVPLVDPETGHPTPYFQRVLEILLKEKNITDLLAEDTAATVLTKADKTLLLTAGAGLTGGGDLSANRTIDVGAGTGITVNPNDVAIDITAEAERIRDVIGAALVAGSNVTITVNDAGDTITIASTGGGGGGTWTLAGSQTIGAAVPQIDFTGITGTEYLLLVRGMTRSVSGVIVTRYSVDNGATYFSTSGDYISIIANGTESNIAFGSSFHSTSSTAARSGIVYIPMGGTSLANKVSWCPNFDGELRVFAASSSPINAIRILNSAGGNLTAGSAYLFTR